MKTGMIITKRCSCYWINTGTSTVCWFCGDTIFCDQSEMRLIPVYVLKKQHQWRSIANSMFLDETEIEEILNAWRLELFL